MSEQPPTGLPIRPEGPVRPMSEWIRAKPGTPEARDFEDRLLWMGRNKAPVPFFESFANLIISRELMSEFLLDVWTGVEVPSRALEQDDWIYLFQEAGFVTDAEEIPAMPLKVFRGAPLDDPRGFSWSWAESSAEWFAKRYQLHLDRPCGIFSITVERGDLLGVSTARGGAEGEREVILDPRTLTGRLEPRLERELQPETSWAA